MFKKPSRKLRTGTNVILSVLLALACWVLVGWINVRHGFRADTTADRTYSLSEKTIAIVRDLKSPLTITTLFRPGTQLERNAKDLLEEYANKSRQIQVTHIDPDRDAARVELLAKRLKLDSFQINSVLFEADGKTKQVAAGEMEETEPSANPFMPSQKPPKFKGEEAFTSAILNLTQSKQPLVYFTAGHGEKDFEGLDRDGVSEMVKFLKRENYRVQKLPTLEQGDVPADADAVVVASPRQKFLSAEAEKLNAYLARGGKMLVFLDPLTQTGLEPMLLSWGIQVDNDVVLDPVRRLFFAGPTTLIVSDFKPHPVVQKLQGSAIILSLARSVRPANDAKGSVQILFETSKEAWGETDLANKQAKYDAGKDIQGPLPLAAALTKSLTKGQGETRLVVVGDGDFLTNAQLSNASNLDFFTNAMNWLTLREKLISIGPKISEIRQITLNAGQMQMIFWFTVLGMPFAGVVAGSSVWFRRRR